MVTRKVEAMATVKGVQKLVVRAEAKVMKGPPGVREGEEVKGEAWAVVTISRKRKKHRTTNKNNLTMPSLTKMSRQKIQLMKNPLA